MPTSFSSTTRSLHYDTPLPSWLSWAAAAVLFGLWLTWFFFGQVTVYENSAFARLEVRDASHPLAAQVAGSVARANVSLGQEVKAGQVLFQLDDSLERLKLAEENTRKQALPNQIQALAREIEAQVATLSNSGQSSQAAVVGARAKWRESQASTSAAEDHAKRLEEISKDGYISEIEWIKKRDEAQQSKLATEAKASEIARLEWEARSRSSQEQSKLQNLKKDLADLDGQLQLSIATVARLEQDIDKHRIVAPVAGRVGEIAPEVRSGAFVKEGQVLAQVIPSGGLKIIAQFLPKDTMGRLHVGQTARLRLDAFPWTQYGSIDAVVSQVGGEIRDGFQQVDLAVTNASVKLPLQHGLTGRVEVTVESTTPANLVLRAAGRMSARSATQDISK